MEPGELICDYLEDAADAPVLQLAVTDNKVTVCSYILPHHPRVRSSATRCNFARLLGTRTCDVASLAI